MIYRKMQKNGLWRGSLARAASDSLHGTCVFCVFFALFPFFFLGATPKKYHETVLPERGGNQGDGRWLHR